MNEYLIKKQISITSGESSFFLLVAYLFFFSLWPFFLDFRVTEKIGISPERIAVLFFVGLGVLLFLTSKEYRRRSVSLIEKFPEINILFFLYVLLRLASCIASGELSGLYYVINEVVVNFGLFYVIIFSRFNQYRCRLLLKILFLSVTIVSCYGLIEYLLQENIFRHLITKETSASIVALAEKWRGGNYRIQSTFEHPLSLVQFIAILFPVVVMPRFVVENLFVRSFAALALISASYFTYSRSSIVVMFFVLSLYLFFGYNKIKVTRSSRPLLSVFRFVLICCFAGVLYLGVVPYVVGKTAQESQSTGTRMVQIVNGVLAIKESPFLGYGPGNSSRVIKNISLDGDQKYRIYRETIDNLFLSKAIESGLPAAIIYLLFLVATVRRVYFGIHSSRNPSLSSWFTWSFCGLVGAIISMSILSIFTVVPLFFVIAAISLSLTGFASVKTCRSCS